MGDGRVCWPPNLAGDHLRLTHRRRWYGWLVIVTGRGSSDYERGPHFRRLTRSGASTAAHEWFQ